MIKVICNLSSVLFLFFSGQAMTQSQLRINEFLARNITIFSDENEQFNDWIEIHNRGEQPIDIGGFFLTDDADSVNKWQIPNTKPDRTTIPAGGFLILWADGSPEEGVLHLNFKLDGDGEYIGLYDTEINLIDSLYFFEQKPDTSFGRRFTEPAVWQFFPVPTPGAPNEDLIQLPIPDVSVSAGMYSGPLTVELSTDSPGVGIYFSLDGSEPTDDTRYLYAGPIQLTETRVLRAKCFDQNGSASEIRTETYLIDEDLNLPVFSLTTDPQNLWGALGIYDNRFEGWEKLVRVEYFENSGRVALAMNAGFKIHGPGGLDQQSLRLYARSRYGTESFVYPFFEEIDVTEFKRLVLRNGGNDCTNSGPRQTHLRDAIVHSLYRQHNPDFPMSAYKPVNVFLNGLYWGIYNLRERQDPFYIESHYGVKNIDFLEYAAEEGEENEKRNAIAGDWTDFEALIQFVHNYDLAEEQHYEYVTSQVDIINLCEYWIIQTGVANYDWPFHNQKFFRSREPGSQWRWVLWDTEFSMAHIWRGSYNWENLARSLSSDPSDSHLEKYPWFAAHRFVPELFRNEGFQKIFINRYYDCLNTVLSTGNVIKTIDSLAAQIRPDMDRHLGRWDGSLRDWNDALEDVRTFARERPAFAEQHLRDYFGLSESISVTLDVQPKEAGSIQINTITPPLYPWQGYYSPDISVTLVAKANPGFTFVSWKELPELKQNPLKLDTASDIEVTALFIPGGSAVEENKKTSQTPTRFGLGQNYPNPFNPTTVITYELPDQAEITLEILNINGRLVRRLVSGRQEVGKHTVEWNGRDDQGRFVTGGLYFYYLRHGKKSLNRKMVFLP